MKGTWKLFLIDHIVCIEGKTKKKNKQNSTYPHVLSEVDDLLQLKPEPDDRIHAEHAHHVLQGKDEVGQERDSHWNTCKSRPLVLQIKPPVKSANVDDLTGFLTLCEKSGKRLAHKYKTKTIRQTCKHE